MTFNDYNTVMYVMYLVLDTVLDAYCISVSLYARGNVCEADMIPLELW